MTYNPKEAFIKPAPVPKSRMPPFFIENPDAMDAFKKYWVSNLKDLSVEMIHTYVLETLIPIMMAREENKEIDEAPEDVQHGVVADQQPSQNTSKHYFVDGHEKPETLAYRPVFTKQYLAHEGQAH